MNNSDRGLIEKALGDCINWDELSGHAESWEIAWIHHAIHQLTHQRSRYPHATDDWIERLRNLKVQRQVNSKLEGIYIAAIKGPKPNWITWAMLILAGIAAITGIVAIFRRP